MRAPPQAGCRKWPWMTSAGRAGEESALAQGAPLSALQRPLQGKGGKALWEPQGQRWALSSARWFLFIALQR